MCVCVQPLAAKILVSGTEDERAMLRSLIDKRKRAVLDREAGLNSKVVFNRKVSTALGTPKGQVTLMQVCADLLHE